MTTNDANPDKTRGKSAVVELTDGTTIDAVHHIIPDGKPVVHLFIESRRGIDASIPLHRVAAVTRSDAARDALSDDRTATPGDMVEWSGEPWTVIEISGDGDHAHVHAESDGARNQCNGPHPSVSVPVEELTVIVTRDDDEHDYELPGGNNGSDDRGRLMTDGGHPSGGVGPSPPDHGYVHDDDLVECENDDCERLTGPSRPRGVCRTCQSEARERQRERQENSGKKLMTDGGQDVADDGDVDVFAQLNAYDDEEIENAVAVEDIEIDTYVDKRFTTTPERGTVDGEKRDVPREREELKWLAGQIDAGTQTTVHVRVLDVRERNDGSADIIVADSTAATAIEIPAQMRPNSDDQPDPVDEYHAGDSVLIERLDTVDVRQNEHYVTLRHGFDAEVSVWDEWDQPGDVPVGVTVDEASTLVNDAERYAYSENHAVRERVVDTIVDEFDVKYVMDTEETWTYNGFAWVPGGEDRLKSTLQEVLPSEVNTKRERNEITEQVQLATQTDENPFQPGPPDDPDLKWKTPVKNGLVDLREDPDQEVEPHKPEHHTTLSEVLAVEHDPEATGDRIDANIEKIATDDVMKRTMYEMMANIIMRNNDFRKAYINYGDEQTGKSFTDKLLEWLIGDDGIEHMSFTRFVSTDDDFEADAAKHSYVVIDDDASGKSITPAQCAAFKRFVGSGGMRSGAKQVQRESFDPYATIKLNLNELPVWKAWDGSIQSRLLPIFYTQQFVASPDPDDPNEHQKKKESELERELKTDEQLSGLLNHLIEAANRLYETGEWSVYEKYYDDMDGRDPEEAHKRLMNKYLNYADTTRRFARAFMTTAEDAVEVRKEDWHTMYRRWCDEQGVDPQDTGPFWTQIRNDDTVYVEFKNPYQSPRVTKYVAPTSKALEYAPAPVKDRIEGLVEAPGFSVGVDETTPIRELPRGEYATIEGEVVTKTMYGDAYDVDGKLSLVIEDDSGGRISVLKPGLSEGAEIIDEFDAALAGDTVRVHSGITSTSEPTMALQDGASSIDIIDRPAGRESDPSDVTDAGDDDDGDSLYDDDVIDAESQADRVQGVKDIVAELEAEHDKGAPTDAVIEACEDKGFDGRA